MKPLRPAWITVTAIIIMLGLAGFAFVEYGTVPALMPLAFGLALVYDLTHHIKSRWLVIVSRVIVITGLGIVILAGITGWWLKGHTVGM